MSSFILKILVVVTATIWGASTPDVKVCKCPYNLDMHFRTPSNPHFIIITEPNPIPPQKLVQKCIFTLTYESAFSDGFLIKLASNHSSSSFVAKHSNILTSQTHYYHFVFNYQTDFLHSRLQLLPREPTTFLCSKTDSITFAHLVSFPF